MRSFSIPQIFENAVSHQGGTVKKWTNTNYEGRDIFNSDMIITVLSNSLPRDFEVKTGVSDSGIVWLEIWTPLRYDGPACYKFSLRGVE